MPSARRLRLLLVGIAAIMVTTLLYTVQRSSDDVSGSAFNDFIQRTKAGLDKAHDGQTVLIDTSKSNVDTSDQEDSARLSKEMRERLKAAEIQAKYSANSKVLKPENPKEVIGVGSSAGGQGGKGGKEKDGKVESEETDEDHQVETLINEILKKSPVIIFSKTTCPYSKRAKGLLLEKYKITPEPYVVELDTHAMGKQIQNRLHEMTGRGTVPNIMINGKSIGGADDILAMDKKNELVDKIQALGSVGGKSVVIKNAFVEKLD